MGLVGCGYWGSKHLRVFNELPNCEVTALCEPSVEAISKQPKAFLPPLVTADYEEFLSATMDAVVIATPAGTHHRLVLQALLSDRHVLVEKPFTTNTAEALALITAAEERGLTLAVGHTYVYHPAVQFLRKFIEAQQLGPLHYAHTARLNFGTLQPDVDVLWDLAPHDLSILLYILQEEPLVAGARGAACVNPRLCEIAHVDLQFPGGPFAHIYVSWLEPTKIRRLTFVGEEKSLVYDDIAQGEMIRVYDKSIKLTSGNGAEDTLVPQYLQGDVTIPFLGGGEPLKNECAHFLDCVRTGQPVISGGWEGLKVVRILEAAEKSLYNGGSEELVSADVWLSHNEGIPTPAIPREPAP